MMGKCYDTSHIEYSLYGGVGIFVDQSWKCFSSFLRDIHDLPWFNRWKDEPGRISLSKDYYGADCFSKETCVFAPIEYTQMLSVLDGTKFVMTNKETGKKHECTAQQWKALHLKEDEWNIEHVYPKEGYAFRQQIVIDQLSNVVNTIRNNPDDRRIIVSAWNVGDLHQMGLPPCHYTFQFYVADKKLSCKLTQRSADMFLGVPFNIAQYAILTRMIAHITGLQAHEFIWCGGDVHLYNNHTEQAKEQIARTPYESPILKFSRPLTNIDDFQFDDFVLDNYISHPTIKAKVSV
jgi:thymidylate synthase